MDEYGFIFGMFKLVPSLTIITIPFFCYLITVELYSNINCLQYHLIKYYEKYQLF
jgi:uncharacterized protein YqgC (DUF456 family)